MSKRHATKSYLNPKIEAAKVMNSGSLKIRKKLDPMTDGQANYMAAIKRSDVTLCEGVVGTGKTYIAVGLAAIDVLDHKSKRDKIIIVRPAVDAGEHLGFLPGSKEEKAGPYVQPMYDAFKEFCRDEVEYKASVETKVIEIQSLAYMRGVTYKNAWVILDEAQNCTRKQLEMFVGRKHNTSKFILCGSSQQCDIGDGQGWLDFIGKLDGGGYREGVVTVARLGRKDIVRDGLIREIMDRLYDVVDEEVEMEDLGPPVTPSAVEYPEDKLGSRYGLDDEVDWLDSRRSSGWGR